MLTPSFEHKKTRLLAGFKEVFTVNKSLLRKEPPVNPMLDMPLQQRQGVEMVGVTPEIANHWLAFNTSNRAMTQAKIDQFRLDMERGEWTYQGDPIRFGYGKLLDGQHRLTALVLAGIKLPMLVVYGLDPETQANMDTGRGRTPRDVLSIEGLGSWESRTLGAAIHTIMAYESGLALYSSAKFLNRQVRDYYLENTASLDASLRTIKVYPRKNPIVAFSRALALHYIFAAKDREATDLFFDRLMLGEDLSKASPIFHLRQRLLSDLIDKKRRSNYEQLHFIVRAWNSFRAGRSNKSQIFMYPRDGESFPEVR